MSAAPAASSPTPAAVPRESAGSLAAPVSALGASVVGLATRRRGAAAGVVLRPGVVVTAASAIGHADKVRVAAPGGDTQTAAVRGIDPSTDLAVIEVTAETGPAAERRLGDSLRAGDVVFAVGREPSGLLHASFGRLGAVGPAWRTWRGGSVDALLRLDGGLYPGLNGAPVADASGRWVGVASAALARHHGIVLPLATVDRVVDQLLQHGRIVRGYLGIAAQAVALGRDGRGLLVAGVADDSPAARAGLLVGDVILSVGGQSVGDVETLLALLGGEPVGARVGLHLLRGGQPLEVVVDIGERPASRCH